MQVLRHYLGDKLRLTLFDILSNIRVKANSLFTNTISNNLIQANKSATTDEQDIGGINVNKLLLRVLTASCWRNTSNRTLKNLQKCLLNAFTGDITSNREVLGLASNLINLIDVDNTYLSALNIAICGSNELKQDILDIFTNVTSLGKGGCVSNGKRNLKKTSKCLSKQGFTSTGWAQEQDVGLCNLNILLAFLRLIVARKNTTIVVVHRYRHSTLCVFLTHYVLRQLIVNLMRSWQIFDDRLIRVSLNL